MLNIKEQYQTRTYTYIHTPVLCVCGWIFLYPDIDFFSETPYLETSMYTAWWQFSDNSIIW